MPFETLDYSHIAHIVADLGHLDEDDDDLDVPTHSRAHAVYDARPSLRHTVYALGLPALMLVLGACASTGATFRSGVGDAFLERAPYYAGASTASLGAGKVAHLPVGFQRGAAQSPIFEPANDAGSEIAALLGEMNAYLATLGASVAIPPAPVTASTVAPDVHFGCATPGAMAGEDCAERGDSALGRGRQTMRLAVGRPSPEWAAGTRAQLVQQGAERSLVITLEMGQYLPRQSGWKGSKSVELGTGNVESLPWLTSLETPVIVLQLTGALLDDSGKAIRIGAEGIAARKTRLLVSAVGGQELFGDDDIRRARSARREDLPGAPLAWQVALKHLVSQLTGVAQTAER